ncbi:valine--tRNA ligase [Ketogulonicigenium vulgare]|uniref:Valine--tRNA ligase n=1 Tax=Ketogulonicigenium vulgare (strain WSH-001) TaxID=759362 RepID=F9Y3H4_KETVW|nr:valine--tRNA ligase [Ketogulonicigenium vulgare]ADO43305.1 valyl-tRNA synthetase [Ketogulonicigenium vulgare Y25]AEM41594.1 Valyl-tRNA synthetase [Ketogulonicigenium vulgare WSH-001]ALJ81711.1 valine--tRNA ligase [Ketogulonicigenium vulgare]ANW34376.1 valine--tRNA ligase [Ketogulonicigenium vulgare]AOZ55343.1 valyl-tRNA synthetase [Ketogulonicigenium vulgare]
MPMEKTFDAASAEARLYQTWESAGAFRAGANASRPETFSIVIPPPNVTGSLHMGHAFNNTLQDILTRWHRMRGFDTLWQPGQDHAGIATQMVVERELAKAGLPGRREMGREAFLDKVWEWKEQSGGTIIQQLKRLGASCDWDRNAFTMDEHFQKAVIKVFVEMYAKGLIYRGKRLVNWDPHFETAISDLEVENVEVAGHMWHFKYKLAGGESYEYVEKDEDGTVTFREMRDWISIATTRPETMLGDGAVAVHPSDARYAAIIGKMIELPLTGRLIPIIADEYPDPTFGSGAVKITGAHDFNDYQVAKRHNLPLYRLMDTKAALRADGLPYAEAAARAAEIAAGAATNEEEIDSLNLVPEKYRGMDRFEARKAIIADIGALGLAVTRLVKTIDKETGAEDLSREAVVDSKPIMQPFGDRSKVVIEPMLTDQWFVDTSKIVGPAIDAVRNGDTQILPERDAKVYFHWLENIEPWCISRQLWWGHQIPVWYGLDLGASNYRDDENDGALDEVEIMRLLSSDRLVHAGAVYHCAADFSGVVENFRDEIADTPMPLSHARIVEVADRAAAIEALAAGLAQYNLTQDPTVLVYPVWRDADVLDTWFSSGLWPIGTLGWPEQTPELAKYFPTNVLVTGFDIIFFWVARMMMMQLAVVDDVPFKTVYVHALVRDEKGKKMSKSLGNVLDPLVLIDEYGADAVRFTLTAMAAMGRDLKLSTQRIAGYRNFGTKLWNAHRFAEMNDVFAARPADGQAPRASQTVNRWIIGETARVREEVDAALDSYRFDVAANALYAFVWGKVCDWYVEFSKPLLSGEDIAARDETRATMAWVLDQCLVLLHPIMPFVTEELWQTTGQRDRLLALSDWPTYAAADLVDAGADAEMSWVISVIEGVRSVRAQMNVPAGLQVPVLQLEADEVARGAWGRNEVLIKRLARIDSLTEAAEVPKGAITVPTAGATFALPLADIIDVAAEKARIGKALDKLAKELGGLRGRLNNPNFVASAPEEVVEEVRENLSLREAEEAQMRAAYDRLAEIG